MRSMSRISCVLAVAALALGSLATTGCASTRAAYNAAETLEERAYVVTEHYTAVITQAADLKNRGVLKGAALAQVREIETVARPVVLSLGDLVANYKAAKSAESEVALQRALDEAVLVLADLVRAVKAAATGGAT
jgi:hydroxymethylpyrimidine pyrophosphatase-like HAD family hydrolase